MATPDATSLFAFCWEQSRSASLVVKRNYAKTWNSLEMFCPRLQKYFVWILISWNLKIDYCPIWYQHSQIFQTKKFYLNIKISIFATEMPYFGIFRLKLEKFCYIWRQHTRISGMQCFEQKLKKLKFVTKIWTIWITFGGNLEKTIILNHIFGMSRLEFAKVKKFKAIQKK